MKNYLQTLLLLACTLIACKQAGSQPEIPEAVKTKFASLYPNAGMPEWEMEDGKYEASFREKDIETSVIFFADGNVFATETEMDVALLQESITGYVNSQLEGKKIKEASKIVLAGGDINFEIEIDNTDYVFDGMGQYLSMAQDESGEKDDDD